MKEVILGFSLGFDTGAAIVSEDGVLAAINEERINREKNTKKFPINAIRECLKLANLEAKDITKIAFSGYEDPDFYNLAKYVPLKNMRKEYIEIYEKIKNDEDELNDLRSNKNINEQLFMNLLKDVLFYNFRDINLLVLSSIARVEHHLAHGLPAFLHSGFDEAIVVTADGFGDGISLRVAKINRKQDYETLKQLGLKDSIALIYQFATGGVGFKMHQHEGKLTGMSARGNWKETKKEFENILRYSSSARSMINNINPDPINEDQKNNPIEQFEYFEKAKDVIFEICKKYDIFDIAAGVQKYTEETVLQLLEDIFKDNNIKNTNICLAGGLFANVRLNQLIGAMDQVDNIFIFPAMGDTGLALGSAEFVLDDFSKIKDLKHAYLGSSINDEEIEDYLRKNAHLEYDKTPDRSRSLAKLIGDGYIVANVKGALEYGPRALCHRSIHFHCDDERVNAWLNKQLGRNEYMPFCPVIQYEDAELAFVDASEKNKHAGEFMTIGYYATDKFKKECPSGVHVDNTARAQLMREDVNPDMYKALDYYKKMTGRIGFINTSYNSHGEPIVRTAKEAIIRFLESNIHYLVINDYVLKHPNLDNMPKFK